MLSDQSLGELPQADKDQDWGREGSRGDLSHSGVLAATQLLPRTLLSEAAKTQASVAEKEMNFEHPSGTPR